MNPIFFLIVGILDLVFWLIVISVIASWLVAFGVLNTRNPLIGRLYEALYSITEPIYRMVRKIIPTTFGGIDIAPVVIILLIQFLQYSVFWVSINFGL